MLPHRPQHPGTWDKRHDCTHHSICAPPPPLVSTCVLWKMGESRVKVVTGRVLEREALMTTSTMGEGLRHGTRYSQLVTTHVSWSFRNAFVPFFSAVLTHMAMCQVRLMKIPACPAQQITFTLPLQAQRHCVGVSPFPFQGLRRNSVPLTTTKGCTTNRDPPTIGPTPAHVKAVFSSTLDICLPPCAGNCLSAFQDRASGWPWAQRSHKGTVPVGFQMSTTCCQWYILKPHFGDSGLPGRDTSKRQISDMILHETPQPWHQTKIGLLIILQILSFLFISATYHLPSARILRVASLPYTCFPFSLGSNKSHP